MLDDVREEDILLCVRPGEDDQVYKVTGMRSSDMYESLGDAVYDVLFLSYMWERNLPLDIQLLGMCKSNSTFCRVVRNSLLRTFISRRSGVKTVADIFESLVGMVFDSMVRKGRTTVTNDLFSWMDEVFSIGKVFHDMVVDRKTPSGSVIRESVGVDLLSSYRLAVQKLEGVYYLFIRLKYVGRGSSIVHLLYHEHSGCLHPSMKESVDHVIGSDDVLRYSASTSDDAVVLFN